MGDRRVSNRRSAAPIGHNVQDARVRVEVRLFNSLARFNGGASAGRPLELAAGSTVGDLMRQLRLPRHEVFLVMRNGRDISPGLYAAGQVNADAALDDGDVIAFSGPVPYSWGYGAPIV
jgi:sulfur carrier protein ThiS